MLVYHTLEGSFSAVSKPMFVRILFYIYNIYALLHHFKLKTWNLREYEESFRKNVEQNNVSNVAKLNECFSNVGQSGAKLC